MAKIELYVPESPLLSIYRKQWKKQAVGEIHVRARHSSPRAKRWMETAQVSISGRMSKQKVAHMPTMEYLAKSRNDVLAHHASWVNLRNITLRERSVAQRLTVHGSI